MKGMIAATCVAMAVLIPAGGAMADNVAGRLGVTGRVGFVVPADGEHVDGRVIESDVGIVGGGGLFYGITNHIATELDVTHSEFGSEHGGANFGDFETTNIALGIQWRFDEPMPHLTPYLGGGVDFLFNYFNTAAGELRNVDDTVGAHVSAGIDYFILPRLALTSEVKGVIAKETDITNPATGGKVGDYDTHSFSMTFGARFFFN